MLVAMPFNTAGQIQFKKRNSDGARAQPGIAHKQIGMNGHET